MRLFRTTRAVILPRRMPPLPRARRDAPPLASPTAQTPRMAPPWKITARDLAQLRHPLLARPKKLPQPEAGAPLATLTISSSDETRYRATRALGDAGRDLPETALPEITRALCYRLQDPVARVRSAALVALRPLFWRLDTAWQETVLRCVSYRLDDPDLTCSSNAHAALRNAARGLPEPHRKMAIAEWVAAGLQHPDEDVRYRAIYSLGDVLPYLAAPDRARFELRVLQSALEPEPLLALPAIMILGRFFPHRIACEWPRFFPPIVSFLREKGKIAGIFHHRATEALEAIAPHIPVPSRRGVLSLVLYAARGCDVASPMAIASIVPGLTVGLPPEGYREFSALLRECVNNDDLRIRCAAVEAAEVLLRTAPESERSDLACILRAGLSDDDPFVQEAAADGLGRAAAQLPSRDLAAIAAELAPHLIDPSPWVRTAVEETLSSLIDRLSPKESIPLWTHLVGTLRLLGPEGLLFLNQQLLPRLRVPAEERASALAILNDPHATRPARHEALFICAPRWGGRLSYGAFKLLLMKGASAIDGHTSTLVFESDEIGEGTGPLPSPQHLGDYLEALSTMWADQERLLVGYPTIGGKLRGLPPWIVPDQLGFLATGEVVADEGEPLALWPARDPTLLAETVMEILRRLGPDNAHETFKYSLTVSGEIGDDLKPAALAVLAQSPLSYDLPAEIKSPAGIDWFAPVVEGYSEGNMGFIPLGPDQERLTAARRPRYDHFFLAFPTPLWRLPKGGASRAAWDAAIARFRAEYRPAVVAIDPEERAIHLTFHAEETEGEETGAVWYPPRTDWQAIVTELQSVTDGSRQHRRVLRHDQTELERRLFCHFQRETCFGYLMKVFHTAWVLGLLRECLREEDQILPFSPGLTAAKRKALRDLAVDFSLRFKAALARKGLQRIVKTPWVGNTDWAAIRDDVRAYQAALAGDPHFKARVLTLVEETIQRAHAILEGTFHHSLTD